MFLPFLLPGPSLPPPRGFFPPPPPPPPPHLYVDRSDTCSIPETYICDMVGNWCCKRLIFLSSVFACKPHNHLRAIRAHQKNQCNRDVPSASHGGVKKAINTDLSQFCTSWCCRWHWICSRLTALQVQCIVVTGLCAGRVVSLTRGFWALFPPAIETAARQPSGTSLPWRWNADIWRVGGCR
jgi:hypothetical protein